jgi:hypothetical protein
MTMNEAIAEVKSGIIDRVRGCGCATINMADGRQYHLVSEYGEPLVERFAPDGELLERTEPANITGAVDHVDWCVDQLGGFFPRRTEFLT